MAPTVNFLIQRLLVYLKSPQGQNRMGGLTGMQFADSIAIEEEEDDITVPLRVSPGNIYAGTGMKLTRNPDFAQSSTLFGETIPKVTENRSREITLETIVERPFPSSNSLKNRDASPITTKRIALDGTISYVTINKTETDQEKAKKFGSVLKDDPSERIIRSQKVITPSGANKPPLPQKSYNIQINNTSAIFSSNSNNPIASQGVTKTYARDKVPLFLFVD
jgi:hypothetical protein